MLSLKYFACCKLHTFIGSIVNANAPILYDTIAEHYEHILLLGNEIDGLQQLPVIFVIAKNDKQRDFIFLDERDGVFDDCFE